jgi:hypothetical protein
VKSKKIQFGPDHAMGSTARLILMGSIDACEPRRKRQRGVFVTALIWLFVLATVGLAVWLILDGLQRGIVLTALA